MKTMTLLIVALVLFATSLFAAVDPNLALVAPEPINFSIAATGTNWELAVAPPDAKNVKRFFRGPMASDQNSQPTLTVRVEPVSEKQKDLREYLRKWLKDYPKFGYNVLGHKPFKLDGQSAFVIDVVSHSGEKQARQVLTVQGEQVVLLTCLDKKDSFMSSLPACNQIIRSLKWEKLTQAL